MDQTQVLERARRQAGLTVLDYKADEEGLRNLSKLVYPGSDSADPSYFSWQYDQNPAGRAISCIGKSGTIIAGQYAVVPLRIKTGDQESHASLSVNTMTHPDYRGRGVFMVLAEEVFKKCREDGNAFTIGFPNPKSHAGFIRRLQFKELGHLPLWIRLLMPLPLLRRTETDRVEELHPDEPGFDDLWRDTRADYPNIVVRDRRYIDWRFFRHPTRRYRVLGFRSGKSLEGYLVTRETKVRGFRCGMLVDLLVRRTSEGEKVAERLIQVALQSFGGGFLKLAGCLAPENSPLAQALARSGFRRCPKMFLPQPFPVIWRWHGSPPAPSQLTAFDQWYLTLGDFDVI